MAAWVLMAAIIVTENLKHFPNQILSTRNMEAKSADAFIADTIALDEGRAVAAIRQMRFHGNERSVNSPVRLHGHERKL
jgi:hypothetical protein